MAYVCHMVHLCIYGGVHIYVLLVTTTISRSVRVRLGVGLFFRSMTSVHRWKKRSVRSQEQEDIRVVCMEKGVRGGFECGHFLVDKQAIWKLDHIND